MNETTYIRFRGELYEVTYNPEGEIVEILIRNNNGQRPELIKFESLDFNLRSMLEDAVSFAIRHHEN